MVEERLTQYINQLSQKGYGLQEIRGYLLQYYPQQEADAALLQFMKQEKQKKMMKILLFSFGVIIILLLVGFLIYKIIPNESESLKNDKTKTAATFTFSVKESIVQQGGVLHYTLNNIPEKRKEIITLNYKIIDKQTDKTAAIWKQIINKEDDFQRQQSYTLPVDFIVGNYKLVIKMSSGKNEKEHSKNVRVITISTEASCFDGIKNQNEKDADCGGVCKKCETCFDTIKNQDEENVDCGGICAESCEKNGEDQKDEEIIESEEQYEKETPKSPSTKKSQETEEKLPKLSYSEIQKDNELKLQAEKSAAISPQEAYNLCTQIISKTTAEDCLYEVAKASNSLNYCGEIQTVREKDSCYMYFATNNNEFACDEIIDAEYKNLCYGLLEIDVYKKKQQENIENGITEPVSIKEFTIVAENKTDMNSPYQLPNKPKIPDKILHLIISDIQSETIDEYNKNISWKTNIASDSLVIYGYGEALNQQQYIDDAVLQHSVILFELAAGEYSFIINSSSGTLSAETNVGVFTLP